MIPMGPRLLIDGEVLAWWFRGGICRVYEHLLPRLAQPWCELDIRVAVAGDLREDLARRICGIDRIPRWQPPSRPWRLWQPVSKAMNAILERRYWKSCEADVFHPTHYSVRPVAAPSLCFVYDMIVERRPQGFPGAYGNRMRALKEKAVRGAAVVMCISESTRRDVVEIYGVPADRCRVVPLAASDGVGPANGAEPLPPRRPFLLYVGDYAAEHKNFHFLVRMLGGHKGARFRDYDLVVVASRAPGPERRAELAACLPGDRLEFVCGCTDAELASYYASCAAFVYPSLYEGFGLPVLEALACGAPTACAYAASLPEVGGTAVAYFDPESEAELADALAACLEEGRGAEAVARRTAHAATFSWDRTAQLFAQAARDASGR